MIVRLPISQ